MVQQQVDGKGSFHAFLMDMLFKGVMRLGHYIQQCIYSVITNSATQDGLFQLAVITEEASTSYG